jgi:hypothetical protein
MGRQGLGVRADTESPLPARRPRGATVGRIAAGAMLLLLAGCVQILTLHERTEAVDGGSSASVGPPTVTGQCGMLRHPSESCAACMDQSCCAEARNCSTDLACQEASDCLVSCTDAACRARCGVFYSLPDSLVDLRSCRIRECATACGSSCGEFATSVSACQACRQANCCSQGSTCASNKGCAALDLCRSTCLSSTCSTDCEAKHPEGIGDFSAWFACTDQCASSCQPGQSWECLDRPIIWPKPKGAGNITFSVTFVDFASERPFVGTLVKACAKLDFPCAAPHSQATTDIDGIVTLRVPVGLVGFDGYLDIRGGKIDGTGSTSFPALLYPLPFIIADGWRGRNQILSEEEFAGFAVATGTTLDPTRGHFAANAADCAFGPAAGVSFLVDSADQRTQSFYLVGGVPGTTALATDQSAIGGFINLPAKLALVRAFSAPANGKSMGSITFIVRAGALTTTSSFPPVP